MKFGHRKMIKNNIFQFKGKKPAAGCEIFESVAEGFGDFKVERILSSQYENGKWYEQSADELVVLLSGEAELEFESERIKLAAGDFIKIQSGVRHRVASTSPENNPCVWLAVFGKFR